MQSREGKVLRLGRAVQLDRDIHQAERDRATRPNAPPIVSLGPVDQTGGNATIAVFSSSREIAPSTLQVRIAANGSGSSTDMPAPGGSVVLIAGGYTVRVFWLDHDNDQLFGTGDALRVTGDSAPLPSSTRFSLEISLVTSSGSMVSGVTWTTH